MKEIAIYGKKESKQTKEYQGRQRYRDWDGLRYVRAGNAVYDSQECNLETDGSDVREGGSGCGEEISGESDDLLDLVKVGETMDLTGSEFAAAAFVPDMKAACVLIPPRTRTAVVGPRTDAEREWYSGLMRDPATNAIARIPFLYNGILCAAAPSDIVAIYGAEALSCFVRGHIALRPKCESVIIYRCADGGLVPCDLGSDSRGLPIIPADIAEPIGERG